MVTDGVPQALRAKLMALLDMCAEYGITLPEQQAYVLATVEHETGRTFDPIHEIGGSKYFEKRYGFRKDLGNRVKGDGDKFHGRGYVQITGRRNYELFEKILGIPLSTNPDLALDPTTAAHILCYGFAHGSFTGKKISDYIRPGKTDYHNARRCINGTDKAAKISAAAIKWLSWIHKNMPAV